MVHHYMTAVNNTTAAVMKDVHAMGPDGDRQIARSIVEKNYLRVVIKCVAEARSPMAEVGGDNEDIGFVIQVLCQQSPIGGLSA